MALVRSTRQQPSSSSNTRFSCDVFLSFRGEDTRKNFTDHLYTAFIDAGIRTFRDDDELERGEEINPELQKAIRQSQSSVVVFSKDYASSGWCLDELALIIERKRTAGHVVLPVFYDVDPSHVRKQTGSLAEAFAKHERNPSLKDKVKQWRAALTEVANLAGMVLQNEVDGHEAKFIKKIVNVIGDKLRRTLVSLDPYLIGIKLRVEKINWWLEDESNNIGIFVIYGMRGIGKTTIAKFVYNSNYEKFERCSFLENIREVSEQANGLVQLQKQLLYDILNGKKVEIHSISEGIAKIEDVVSSKRVLLVLDDVDHVDQLDALLRIQDRLYPGSKIIITTSCVGLFEAHHQFVEVHKVETLSFDESLALFSWHAFGQDHPIHSYWDHSKRLIDHCGGLPLSLKVLGSSLSGKNIAAWDSALNKLEAIPNGEILKKLRISYDSLQDDHDKNLFLHIACFFIGMEKDAIVVILDDCDFFTELGIQSLIDRCLVTIDEYNKVQMHDMIRDMGRGIVRLESKEPGERSRLWHHKDSFQVLTENNGTQAVEGLVLNMHMLPAFSPRNSNKVVLETNSFTRMPKLRFLQLSHVQLSGCYQEFPKRLRWLCWTKFPFASLPTDFPLESLVALEMCYSSLRQLWRGKKNLGSLKILNLSHSHDLSESPDFSSVPNLERLNLKDCVSLVDVHECIVSLERLVYLNVENCKSIRKLPKNIYMLISLETLIISGCSSLNELPIDMKKIESLKVFQADGVPIHRLLTTTGEVELWPTPVLEISWASYLPRSLVNLSLRNCNLFDDDFPRDFSSLSSLQKLDVGENPISSLPNCIRGVTGLQELSFSYCTKLKSLVRLPGVSALLADNCTSLEKITYQSASHRPRSFGLHFDHKLVEIEGWHKLEPIDRVDVEMINLLSLSNLESLGSIMMGSALPYNPGWKGMHPVQGLYEDGIFSTFLPRNEVPGQFSHRIKGSSISFNVPILANLTIRGLNVFSVIAKSNNDDSDPTINIVNIDDSDHPAITVVSNKSKDLKWIYGPKFYGIPGDGKDMIWLSHWKFGNRLEGGDVVTILIYTKSEFKVKECGFQLVYHDQEQKNINSTQLYTASDDPCFLRAGVSSTLDVYQIRGISFKCRAPGIYDNMDLIRDINEKTEREEGQQGELILTPAAKSGSNSNSNNNNSDPKGQQGELILTPAAKSGSNSNSNNNNSDPKGKEEGRQGELILNGGCRGRKGYIIIAFFFFLSVFSAMLSNFFWREKQQATILMPS